MIPEGCRLVTPDRQQLTPGAVVVRGTLACDGGLAGKTLRIAGLETTMTDVLVRITHADGRVESHLLRPATPSLTLGAATSGLERAAVLPAAGRAAHPARRRPPALRARAAADRPRPLDAGEDDHLVHRGAQHHAGHRDAGLRERAACRPLNAAIALSILFLGPEIVRAWRGETSFTIRHPWVVAFAFGLLHGFGFASGLTAMGLPKAEIPLALLLFNVGVEIGQLVFVVLVLLLERAFRTLEIRWPRRGGAARLRGRLARRVLDDPAGGRAGVKLAVTIPAEADNSGVVR